MTRIHLSIAIGDGHLIIESLANEIVSYLGVQIQDLGIDISNLGPPQTIPYGALPLVAQRPKHNGLTTYNQHERK